MGASITEITKKCLKIASFLTLILWIFLQEKDAIGHNLPGNEGNSIQFIANEGQWNKQVEYKAKLPGGQLFVESDGLTYQLWDQEQLSKMHHKKIPPDSIQAHVLKMNMLNSNVPSSIETAHAGKAQYNYLKGARNKHVKGLHGYRSIKLKEVYSNIDLELRGNPRGIKYDFIVKPGGNPNDIQLHWEGAKAIRKQEGQLQIKTSLEPIIEKTPIAFQSKNNPKDTIACHFGINGDTISFNLPENFDPKRTLVIDPEVVFATFSGSYADNWGFTGTFDSLGHAYSGGTVYNSGFPTDAGSYQANFAGGENREGNVGDLARDAGILKYSPDGSELLYATYLGGSHNEQPHSMVVNNNLELLIYGTTRSQNFPTTPNSFNRDLQGGADIYVAKLSKDGSQLLSSTLIGGDRDDGLNGEYRANGPRDYWNVTELGYNFGDIYRGEIIINENNEIYIASCTRSKNFPTSSNALQSSYQGGYQDGCLLKFTSDLSTLEWSSFIGGLNEDAAYSLKLDAKDNIYVTGGTKSRDLPVTDNGHSPYFNGGALDAYILQVKEDGSKVLNGTYLGTSDLDQNYFVDLDEVGNVYVTGQTEGDFPIENVDVANPNSGQYIAKLPPSLDQVLYSTEFGSGTNNPDIAPSAFMVDYCGNIYLSGWGGRTNDHSRSEGTSTRGLPLTENAYQSTTDGSDFYVAVFRKGMDSLLYASFFGGPQSAEHVDGGTSRFRENGVVYQSVCGGCRGYSDFPVTEDAWSKSNNSNNCNNAFFKIDLDVANDPPKAQDEVIEVFATDTVNHTITIKDKNFDDSIFLDYASPIFHEDSIDGPTASITPEKGFQSFGANLRWPTTCDQIDTFEVELFLKDNGCPVFKSSTYKIKIIVKPPPVFDPPKIFCSETLSSDAFKLEWNDFNINQYLNYYKLIRQNPDGTQIILDSFSSPHKKAFVDEGLDQLRKNRYCYYLKSVNVCGKEGPRSYSICTNEDKAPEKINIKNVTVVNDENVKVSWKPASDSDFLHYEVYRKPVGADSFELLKTFMNRYDTTFIDNKVNVQDRSYCYRIYVKDLCGLYSSKGRKGCSIVLKGDSEPFEHNLSWNPYKNWKLGVEHYTVYRKDPLFDTIFKPIAEIDGDEMEFLDDDLNYDVGAYWYRVKARKKPSPKEHEPIKSTSNTIYLVQEPLLHVPNAFTINRDGINEKWGLEPVFVKDIHVWVYNRWGEKVYETTDKEATWEGPEKHSYEEKFDNVFIYMINYTGWDGSFHNTNGNITILK